MNARGKSTRSKQNAKWSRELSLHWQSKGQLDYCELKFDCCVGTYGLAPAHSKDRRDIHSKEDFFEVVCACQACHFYADRTLAKDDRLSLFKEIIANREN